MPQTHVLTLDLKDDAHLIAQYEAFHAPGAVWPEIEASIRAAGVLSMRIFRDGTRLAMVMEVDDAFSFARKAELDAANPKVQAWERLMEQFQAVAPGQEDGKWRPMRQIFALSEA